MGKGGQNPAKAVSVSTMDDHFNPLADSVSPLVDYTYSVTQRLVARGERIGATMVRDGTAKASWLTNFLNKPNSSNDQQSGESHSISRETVQANQADSDKCTMGDIAKMAAKVTVLADTSKSEPGFLTRSAAKFSTDKYRLMNGLMGTFSY